MRRVMATILCAACAGAAQAQPIDCADPATQAAMTACADRDRQAADDALSAMYRSLANRLPGPDRDALREARRAWIAYRDAQCAFESAGVRGGSVHPFVLATCLAEITQMQTDRLVRQLECEEGDVACARY